MPLTRTPAFTIKIAENKEEIEACYDIRVEVFAVEQGFPVETEIDEYDPISAHFLLSVAESSPPPESTLSISPFSKAAPSSTTKPIGTIRWTPSVGKVARLAILPGYRHYGFGRKLMNALHEEASKGGKEMDQVMKYVDGRRVAQLKLHAQIQVIPFYMRMGYRSEGEPFDEEGAPHQKMIREIEIVQ